MPLVVVAMLITALSPVEEGVEGIEVRRLVAPIIVAAVVSFADIRTAGPLDGLIVTTVAPTVDEVARPRPRPRLTRPIEAVVASRP